MELWVAGSLSTAEWFELHGRVIVQSRVQRGSCCRPPRRTRGLPPGLSDCAVGRAVDLFLSSSPIRRRAALGSSAAVGVDGTALRGRSRVRGSSPRRAALRHRCRIWHRIPIATLKTLITAPASIRSMTRRLNSRLYVQRGDFDTPSTRETCPSFSLSHLKGATIPLVSPLLGRTTPGGRSSHLGHRPEL